MKSENASCGIILWEALPLNGRIAKNRIGR